MSIAKGISEFMRANHIPYDVLWHEHADTSLRAAHKANIAARHVVKAVVLESEGGKLFVVLVPANRMIDFAAVAEYIGGGARLASPERFKSVFRDCATGVVPATAPAYGFTTFLDENLAQASDLYFDAGDQEEMIHVKGNLFRRALGPVYIGEFTRADVVQEYC